MIYQFVAEGETVALPEGLAPYRCVVLIDRSVGPAFRMDVSRTLVATGCRYMMA